MKSKYFAPINFEKLWKTYNVANKIVDPHNFEPKILVRLGKDEQLVYYKQKIFSSTADKGQKFKNVVIIL